MARRDALATRVQVYLNDPKVVSSLNREAKVGRIALSQAAGQAIVRGLARNPKADPEDRLLNLERSLRDHMRSTGRDMQIVQELLIEVARAFFLRLPDAVADEERHPVRGGASQARAGASFGRRLTVPPTFLINESLPMTEPAPFEQFLAIDVRVGTIVQVDAFPEARKPAWKLTIDLGPEIGVKRSSAQIVDLYQASGLVGRQVACVVNLGARRIGPFMSEVLTLGFSDEAGRVVLVQPERPVPNGSRMF